MSDMTQAFGDLPIVSMVPIALGLVIGVVLWAAGQRILVAAFATVGFLVGAVIGWAVGGWIDLAGSTWIAAAIGAGVLACLAALAAKIVVAGALAIVFGIAGPLLVLAAAQLSGTTVDSDAPTTSEEAEVAPQEPDELDRWVESLTNPFGEDSPIDPVALAEDAVSESLGLTEETEQKLQQIDDVIGNITEAIKTWWDETPPKVRPAMMASALVGMLAGVLLGTLAGAFSATVVTSFGGSLLWLSCARVLVTITDLPEGPWLPATPVAWLALWVITAVIGLAIQWTFRPKRADKPAS